jgi:tetratricopeptide (TPR) repeat protein
MFSGDVETQWKAGAISTDHARRLWEGMSLTTQAFVECGHHVIDTLVDGSALLTRMTAASAPLISDSVKSLKALVNQSFFQKDNISQSNLFEQVTRVLFKLAELHPLLVILDDLQWIDPASAGLLFHLGRRTNGKRLLIACAYRPEEVSYHPDGVGERHPLEHVLAEFKGRFADAYLDLARFDDSEGRSFINAYLDSESNTLDSNFREALYKRTAGHPLFTIELLHAMQDEGTLVQDSDETWFLKREPNWRQIPTRVEGVIGKRIDRLNPELRDILRIASIEGDIFSAQVIADVINMSERNVLRLLSGPLEKKHRLVSYSKEIKVGDQHLSQYSFAHVLYRDYAYNDLNPGERRPLHQRVGSRLEDFYQGRTEEIAVQLATHFVGIPEKERFYSRQAGEWAEARFANDEAIYHLNKALDLTPETDFKERYELLLALEKIHDLVGNRETQKQILMALQEVAESLHDPHPQATVALRQATLDWYLGNYSASIAQCMKAKRLLNSRPDPELEAEIHRRWALSLSRLGNVHRARKFFKKSIKQAQIAGSRWLEAENYRHLGNNYVIEDDPGSAMIYFNKSLPILREVGDRLDQIRILHSMALSNFMLFEYQKAKGEWEEALQICMEIGSAFYENVMRYSYASVFEVCGQYEVARELYQAALEFSYEVEDRASEARALASIGVTSYFLKDHQKAHTYLRDSLQVAKDIQETHVEAYISTAFGNVHLAQNQYSEAVQNFNKSIELFQSLGMDCASLEPLSGLAQVYLEEKDLSKAMTYVENILKYLEKGNLPSTEQPLQIYFRCYQVLQARHDPRANIVLDTAHTLLQEWAGRIEDIELHSSFLENVPANRAILDAWKNRVESCSP